MGIIGVILFLAIGIGAAWAFDKLVLNRSISSVTVLEGERLVEILKRSKSYEDIQNRQEVSRHRPIDRGRNHGGRVGQLGPGRDG